MKYLPVLFFSLTSVKLLAQLNFDLVPEQINSLNVYSEIHDKGAGTAFFADLDNDGDKDAITTGESTNSAFVTNVYLNDGSGNMIDNGSTGIMGLVDSDLDMADVDNDGDLDLLICGYNPDLDAFTHLYLNDGSANFSLSSSVFEGIAEGNIAFGYINADTFPDIILSGSDVDGNAIAKVYQNDGLGNFDTEISTPIRRLYFGGLIAADLNKDGLSDIIQWGETGIFTNESVFFLNDSTNGLTLVSNGVPPTFNRINSIDANADGNTDLVLQAGGTTAIYINDGTANFTRDQQVLNSEIRNITPFNFNDDAFPDLLVPNNTDSIDIYLNSTGIFNFEKTIPLDLKNHLFVGDLTGDKRDEVLIQGASLFNNDIRFFGLYYNVDGDTLVRPESSPFKLLINQEAIHLDIDRDDDQDIIISGEFPNGVPQCYIYENDNGKFTISGNHSIQAVLNQSMDTADVDNDGDIDLVVSGAIPPSTSPTESIIIYLNDGNGVFSPKLPNDLFQLRAEVNFMDIDNDGDEDLIYTGLEYGVGFFSKAYLNDGNANFTEITNHNIPVFSQDATLFEVHLNNDDLLDLVAIGLGLNLLDPNPITQVLLNTGNNSFTSILPVGTPGISGDFEVIDLENDNDNDLIFSGSGHSFVLQNDGNGGLTFLENVGFLPLLASQIVAQDLNNNGTKEIIMTGLDTSNDAQSVVYEYDGALGFNLIFADLAPSYRGSLLSFDANADSKNDIIYFGKDSLNFPISRYYLNTTCKTVDTTFEVFSCSAYSSPSGKIWSVSGLYADTIISSQGCDSIVNINLTINTESAMITNLSNKLSVVSLGNSYQWINCSNNSLISGADLQEYEPTVSGDYACIVELPNGCIDTSACENFTVVGIKTANGAHLFSVFPNPFKDDLTIKSPIEGITVRLLSLQGELIYRKDSFQKIETVFPGIESGTYLIEISKYGEVLKTELITKI